MSSIQCPSCKSIVLAYARFCKHCGAVINSAPNTGPVRHFPVTGAFNPANSDNASAYHRPANAEQAWGQREESAGYAPATIDTAPSEGPPGKRRPDPDTERLPTTKNIKRPLRLEKLSPAEDLPIVAKLEQPQHAAAPQSIQRPGPRPPARPAYVLPSTQPQQRLGVQQHPSAPAPPHVTPRLRSVQLRKIQAQELLAQHPLLPIEQQVSEEEVKQATLQNLTGLPSSAQRLEVQSVYPIALMRQEPFSLPTSLRIPSLKRTASKRLLIWEIILVILLLIGIIGGLLLIFTHAFPSLPGAPSKPTLTLIGQALPGSKVTLHGKNFAPGSSVKFRLDTVPLARTTMLSNALASYSTQMQIENAASAVDTTGMIVRRDGTFDKTFTIPLQWKSGSAHSIEVDVQAKQTAISVRLNFVVSANSSALTPEPTAARSIPTPRHTAQPTPKVVPTPVPTPVSALAPTSSPIEVSCINATPRQLSLRSLVGKGGNTVAITINNCGDAGTWTSSVLTDDGGNWLWLGVGHGWLAGGAAQRISLAHAALNAGTYTGTITFSSGGAHAVSVNVSLVVAAQPTCIRTHPDRR